MNYLLQIKIKQIKIWSETNAVHSIININQKYINVIQVPGKCIYPEHGSVDPSRLYFLHPYNGDKEYGYIVLTASYNLPH